MSLIYTDTLAMDLFVPETDGNKPLLIYVHGGGFAAGKRNHENYIWFCEYFAKKGWVIATISYHLTMKGKSFGCDQKVANKIETIFRAAQDVNQATAFLLERRDTYEIDDNSIVISGSSAGAEAAIHATYWSKTQDEILPPDFKYAGVISMAGALLDENWITRDSAIPTALFHGTCDNLVPYSTASHHYCTTGEAGFLMLFGSGAIASRLRQLDKGHYLLTDCGGGHEWNEKPIWPDYIYLIEDFLKYDVLKGQQRQVHLRFSEGKRNCSYGLTSCDSVAE